MRAFWDRHRNWTHDILEADAEDIRFGKGFAGSHHLDPGIKPYTFSSDEYVDRLQYRILMAVAKYQAAVARSRKLMMKPSIWSEDTISKIRE